MINSKEQIIEFFKSGIKEEKNFKIGIEHEKFLFNKKDNKRIDYSEIKKMFAELLEFGWNPITEKGNIIGLNNGDKNISLEPGNQIELSGAKLNNIHAPRPRLPLRSSRQNLASEPRPTEKPHESIARRRTTLT